jgi:hypothetical protein
MAEIVAGGLGCLSGVGARPAVAARRLREHGSQQKNFLSFVSCEFCPDGDDPTTTVPSAGRKDIGSEHGQPLL